MGNVINMETINEAREVKARKDHMCNWCGFKIDKGEKYQTATYKVDYIYTWKNHIKCMELVTALNMEGDEGINGDDFYNYITDDFRNHIEDEIYESKGYVIPSFDKQMELVYAKRCGGISNNN